MGNFFEDIGDQLSDGFMMVADPLSSVRDIFGGGGSTNYSAQMEGLFDYSTPDKWRRALMWEMGRPNSYLSPNNPLARSRLTQRSRAETSKGLRGIVQGAARSELNLVNALGASGLNRRYATAAASGVGEQAGVMAGQYVADQYGTLLGEREALRNQQAERRFGAGTAYLNMLGQYEMAGKNNQANLLAAQMGADATRAAGKSTEMSGLLQGAGMLFGGML